MQIEIQVVWFNFTQFNASTLQACCCYTKQCIFLTQFSHRDPTSWEIIQKRFNRHIQADQTQVLSTKINLRNKEILRTAGILGTDGIEERRGWIIRRPMLLDLVQFGFYLFFFFFSSYRSHSTLHPRQILTCSKKILPPTPRSKTLGQSVHFS